MSTLITPVRRSDRVKAFDEALSQVTGYPCEVALEFRDLSPLEWLAAQPTGEKLFWMDRGSRRPMAGWRAADMIAQSANESRSEFVQRCRATLADHADIRMFGGFAFDERQSHEREWSTFGLGRFWLPRISYDGGCLRVIVCNQHDIAAARAAIAECETRSDGWPPPIPVATSRQNDPTEQVWSEELRQCQRLFALEILEKIVLVRRCRLTFAEAVDPLAVLLQLHRSVYSSYLFCFQPGETASFIGISPERLFSRIGDQIESEIVAGTRPRGHQEAADRRLRDELLSSAKDQLEHDIVRKSIRQRLHQYVVDLQVDSQAHVMSLPSTQHLYSAVRARLKPGVDDGTLIDRLHPTPALGGYPTENALAEIQRLESFGRGWYGGPVGWISRDSIELAVGIRSALISDNQAYLYSGAGIVPGSTADDEWQEIEQKIQDYLQLFCPVM